MFPQDSSCPVVLWILATRFLFRLRESHPLCRIFPNPSARFHSLMPVLTPKVRRLSVWALPLSLAATQRISVDYFSSGYLDVSVHQVCLPNIGIMEHDFHWVAPFGDTWINARLRLPMSFRSLPRPSSTRNAKASAIRPW